MPCIDIITIIFEKKNFSSNICPYRPCCTLEIFIPDNPGKDQDLVPKEIFLLKLFVVGSKWGSVA